MKETNILYIIIICIVVLHLISNYTNHLNTSNLQDTIIQYEQQIAELENKNTICVEHCTEIVNIDNKIILDLAGMFTKLDTYYKQPDLMVLDASVIMSSAERNIEKKNELLEQLEIEYNEPIYHK